MGTSVMAALFYILTLLTLLAHGCPPPFNDFEYVDNDTLLREKIDGYKSNPQLGWAHAVGGVSALRPWPANAQGIVLIPYCFEDAWAKKKDRKEVPRWVGKVVQQDRRPQSTDWPSSRRLSGSQRRQWSTYVLLQRRGKRVMEPKSTWRYLKDHCPRRHCRDFFVDGL